jgi:hypothetical protein
MLKTVGDSAGALSLALAARLAVKALSNLQDQSAPDNDLEATLQDVLASLDAIRTGGPLFAHLTPASNFEHFGQIQTLAEVNSAFRDQQLTERLRSIMTAAPDEAERERNIDFAIDFFTALEGRALQKYNQAANLGY